MTLAKTLMNFTITGHHIEITDAMHDFAKNKISILENRLENIVSTSLHVTNDTKTVKVEGTVLLKGNKIFASVEGNNVKEVYEMIDNVVSKLERQIRKHKGKTNHIKKGNTSVKDLVVDEEV